MALPLTLSLVYMLVAMALQEVYECAQAGARAVKLFPAQLWSPGTLKSMRGVGMFGGLNIIPSGKSALWPPRPCLAGSFDLGMVFVWLIAPIVRPYLSGGITPASYSEWLDAGAFAVGMGSKLVGGEVRVPASADGAALAAAAAEWKATGRAQAAAVLSAAAARTGTTASVGGPTAAAVTRVAGGATTTMTTTAAASVTSGAQGGSSSALKATLESMGQSRGIAILRAKNPDVAIERGVELVDMGTCGSWMGRRV